MGDLLTASAIVASALTWYISHRQDIVAARKAAAKALYDEFCSEDMLQSRIASDRLLESELAAESKSDEQLYEQMNPEDWIHISKTLHFFERAEVSMRLELVEPILAVELLKKDYCYYWNRYFARMHFAHEQAAQKGDSTKLWRELKSLSHRVGCAD